MKKLNVTLVCLVAPIVVFSTQITEEIQPDTDWKTIGGGFYSTSIGGLDPIAGDRFWTAANAASKGNKSRGIWKLFPDVFTAENLEVTYYVGDRNDFVWTEKVAALLFADINNDKIYQWGERITNTASSSHPIVKDGAWAKWTDTYTINATTQTASGDLVLGKTLGFFIVNHVAPDENLAFDSLVIKTIP